MIASVLSDNQDVERSPAPRESVTSIADLQNRLNDGGTDALQRSRVDATVADTAGEFARHFARSHTGIDTTDYLIAAAAQSIGARLVTVNVKHYPMFEALVRPY